MAPVGHTWPQRLQVWSHPASRGTMRGDQMPSSPLSQRQGCRVLVRHTFMHSPQRMHFAENIFSGSAPGGRISRGLR